MKGQSMNNIDNRRQILLDTIKNHIHDENPLEDINLFSILKMESKEVSAHSAFLFYIFKPFTINSRRDDKNLRILFHHIMPGQKEPDYIDIHREVTTEFGRVDFLIEYETDSRQNAIVIELKIWAGEQHEQIKRYRNYMVSNSWNPDNIFFLTPDRRESQTGKSNNITLKHQINHALNEIISIRNDYKNYQIIIEQYQKIIDTLTGERFMDELNIIKSSKDIKAIDELYNIKTDALKELLRKFLETLQIKLTSPNGLFDTSTGTKLNARFEKSESFNRSEIDVYYKRGSKSWPVIAYHMNKYYLKSILKESIDDDIEIYYFIEINSYLYTGFTIRKTENDSIISVNISDKLKEILNKIKKVEDKSTPFFNWEYVKCNNYRIRFDGYSEYDGFLRLLDEDSLEFNKNEINKIAMNIKEAFDRDCQLYFDIR